MLFLLVGRDTGTSQVRIITRRLLRAGEGDVEVHFDGHLLLVSIVMAIAGGFGSLTTVTYLRKVRNSRWYAILLIQSGLGLGVATVWSMHFIGMQSVSLISVETKAEIGIMFDVGLTILSALTAWVFSILAIRQCLQKTSGRTTARKSWIRVVSAAFLLSFGVGGMHYLGMVAERGQFQTLYSPALVVASVIQCVVFCAGIVAVIIYLPDSNAWRFPASLVVGALSSAIHYVGMVPVSYRADAIGATWTIIDVGTMDVVAEAVIIISLLCDLLLMAANAFYLEVIQEQDKSEIECELQHRQFVKGSRALMKRCKAMQFPLTLIRATEFLTLGKLAAHEWLRDKKLLIMLDTPGAAARFRRRGCIVFISHQWLSCDFPDPEGKQFKHMKYAVHELCKLKCLTIEDIFIWVDYCSIPQASAGQQQLAINSLPAYVSACSAFVVVAPDVQDPVYNFETYSKRFWCRLEVFCAVMTAVTHHQSSGQSFLDRTSMRRMSTSDLSPSDAADSEYVQSRQRLYFVRQEGSQEPYLEPLVFISENGLESKYIELLRVYTGQLGCCSRNHLTRSGEELPCDKDRVVETLTGLYGVMLVALQKAQSQGQNQLLRSLVQLRSMLIEQRDLLFPVEHFSTRIEAMHEYVNSRAPSRDTIVADRSMVHAPSHGTSIVDRSIVMDRSAHETILDLSRAFVSADDSGMDEGDDVEWVGSGTTFSMKEHEESVPADRGQPVVIGHAEADATVTGQPPDEPFALSERFSSWY